MPHPEDFSRKGGLGIRISRGAYFVRLIESNLDFILHAYVQGNVWQYLILLSVLMLVPCHLFLANPSIALEYK